jgi:hypothetical protein
MQIIPAAACARSLVETAASIWIDSGKLRKIWSDTKIDCAANGPSPRQWEIFNIEIYKMLWAAKFDSKVPDLEKSFGRLHRTNVLTLVDKLARCTDYPLHEDYQWLCNAVHPSIGGMLTFTSPFMKHPTGTHLFQFVCEAPTHNWNSRTDVRTDVRTIQDAIARAAVLAVEVLERTLDDALRLVDDVGLTTEAPSMASFDYWRNVVSQRGSASCPCRSGRNAKDCLHRWTDPAPTIVEQFRVRPTTA